MTTLSPFEIVLGTMMMSLPTWLFVSVGWRLCTVRMPNFFQCWYGCVCVRVCFFVRVPSWVVPLDPCPLGDVLPWSLGLVFAEDWWWNLQYVVWKPHGHQVCFHRALAFWMNSEWQEGEDWFMARCTVDLYPPVVPVICTVTCVCVWKAKKHQLPRLTVAVTLWFLRSSADSAGQGRSMAWCRYTETVALKIQCMLH